MSGAAIQLAVAVAGALIFFLVARLAVAGLHRLFEPGLGRVRPLFLQIDRFLVERVSVWIGLSEPLVWRRWSRMIAALLAPAAFGAFTPSAIAVPALIAGLIAVLAVFRRWAWDEEDRALGLAPHEKRAPGVEDFNDEALAALAAVFMLSSLLVWRLTGLQAFTQDAPGGLGPFLLYMGSEALEAVPIVGNVEVLGYENPSGVRAVLPSGGWIAFMLRMALDLVVIGGLLKAIEIAGRVSRGQDLRREDEAIRQGHPPRVKQAVETLTRLSYGEDLAALERLKHLARALTGEQAPPRFRLMAIDALDTIANHRPRLADDIFNFNHGAALDLLEDPSLETLGYLPAAHLQLHFAQAGCYERSHGETARAMLNASAVSLAHALTKPGHTAFSDAYLLDTPRPMTGAERADLAVRYARALLGMSDIVSPAGAPPFLNEGLTSVEGALRLLDEQEAPWDWAAAWEMKGQLLTRLGQHDGSATGDERLRQAAEAFETAGRVRGRDTASEDWFRLRMSRGVLEAESARRLTGIPALEAYQRAADLYVEVINGLGSLGTEPAVVARALLNHGGVLMDGAWIHLSEPEPDPQTAVHLAGEAAQSYLQALHALEGLGLKPELIEAYRGMALSHRMLADHGDDPDAILMVAAARASLLKEIDEARDPAAWAVAALELAAAEHAAGQDAPSDLLIRNGLEHVLKAREIVKRYHMQDSIDFADTLEKAIRKSLTRFETTPAGPPDDETIH